MVYLELLLMFLIFSYEIEGKSDIDFFSFSDDFKGKFRKVYFNEFIVWKVESVFFLR